MKGLNFLLIATFAVGACGKTDRPAHNSQSQADRFRIASANDEIIGTWVVKCEKMNNGLTSGNGTVTFNADNSLTSHVKVYLNSGCVGKGYNKADLSGTYQASLQDDSEQK